MKFDWKTFVAELLRLVAAALAGWGGATALL